VQKLRSEGDRVSADLVGAIVDDEVQHVKFGLKWFTRLTRSLKGDVDPVSEFHAVVRKYVPDLLPGPFNEAARSLARFTPDWYRPVSKGQRSFSTSTRQNSQRCDHPVVLLVFSVWPEPRSSAAGIRDVGLLQAVSKELQASQVHIASPAKPKWEATGDSVHLLLRCPAADTSFPSSEAVNLTGVHTTPPNGPEFECVLKQVKPDVVVFDRVSTEEMFGWQVHTHAPDAVRILDTQDLHFLVRVCRVRRARLFPMEVSCCRGMRVMLWFKLAEVTWMR
jgi:hypothetical protein